MITGLHHVSMKCGTPGELERVKAFYCGVLGLPVCRAWPEGVLIGAGGGLIEVFCTGRGETGKGAVRHFALASDDVDGDIEKVRLAGYPVLIEPKGIAMGSDPACPARIAFCAGPLGEEIELFQQL